jgi:tetratricopeptide (TPR) repeat protein/Mrp family chromosome partitioning ATPase
MNITRADRRFVTFYSYKGGVGRSMAAANVAFRLADRNALDVIVVDWDLEAPGLHRFFGISDEVAASTTGLLDYLLAWREAVEEDADGPPDAMGSLIRVTEPGPANGSLSLLLAGRLDRGYSDRLRGFDWLPFYRFNAGYAAIETLREQLAGKADMVLIDSRTGVTDAGGICTVQVPDGVVLMTAANEQSWKGIERVGRSIAEGERERPGRPVPKVWVAVGRAPYLDVPRHGEDWFEEYGPRFEAGCEEKLWAKADHPHGLHSYRLPHVGRWGFGEQILDTQLDTDDELARAYRALSDEIIQWAMGKEVQDRDQGEGQSRTIEDMRRDVEEAEKRGDLARVLAGLLKLAHALSEAGELASAAEMAQRAAGITLGVGQPQYYAIALNLLAEVRLREKRFDDAEELYERAIEAAPRNAAVLGNYANVIKNIRKDPDRAEELYRRAIDADPKSAINLGNYANFLNNIRKDPDKAEELYKRAIKADPKNTNHLGNYAGMLLATGRQTGGLSMLDRAFDAPAGSPALRAECWFYALAHRPPERRGEALAQLKRLVVAEGARSPGWDFSGNVERARSDGHPDAVWLALLADVISEKAEPAVLDAWPAWAAA